MRSLNRIVLVGNLGQDPEIRTLEGGVKVGRFSLATTESYKDASGQWQDSPTEWHNIIVWRNLAERAERELKKGKSVYVEGKVNYRSWTDKDGNNRRNTDIVARYFRTFERIESQGGTSGGNSSFPSAADAPSPYVNVPATNNNNTPAPATTPKPAAPKPIVEEGDDLPF